jgi:predicted aspartyl protease
MNRFMTAAGCAALAWPIALPAMAACSLKTQPIPVTLDGGLRPMVDVKVNGKTAHFVIDSESAVNQISSKYAEAQKLPQTQAGSATIVTAPQFEFAGATLKNVQFAAADALDVDGLIGQTILSQADVEYDLGSASAPASAAAASAGASSGRGGRGGSSGPPAGFGPPPTGTVKLVQAVGCEGVNMAYWAKEGDAYSEMPLTVLDNDPRTHTEVVVNGVKMRALLASGVRYTMITRKAAEKAGVKTSDPGVKAYQSAAAWIAPFASLKFGDEEIRNQPLEIAETSDDAYDILIGDDFLKAHHLYVAKGQRKIYLTYTGKPGTPIFQAHEPKKAAFGMSGRTGAGIQVSGP